MSPKKLSFWNKKKVLITGHTGFQGSWLSLWLQSLGADVVGYALDPPTQPNLFTVASVGEGMTSIHGDILDFKSLHQTIHGHSPELVFHLAAQSLLGNSFQDPRGTYAANILGTVNILNAVRKNPTVKALICVTSDKCYENQGKGKPFGEEDPLGGNDPYSVSKAGAELMISAFRESCFGALGDSSPTFVASARAGNVIGGGDWAEGRLVPDILRALQNRQPVVLRNPNGVRPWQHVLEPLGGYILLGERLFKEGRAFSRGWNFGPLTENLPNASEIAAMIVKKWAGTHEVLKAKESFYEDKILRLDSSLANEKLGWSTRLTLEEALQWAVDWIRANESKKDMRNFTLEQISHYQNKIAL